ncbi:hypothetical protein C7271_03600 [filamentous cyanobacterium CCP5]|nr:hypothetical protein C7271_03600 [filamentous cyanobacterium CCP5]
MRGSVKSIITQLPSSYEKAIVKSIRNFTFETKTYLARVSRHLSRPPAPQNSNGEIYVHLGCGQINHPSFINVDLIPYKHIHYVRPIDNLRIFKDQSVDIIYASHCLEHFPWRKINEVINEWFRVLKDDGILRLSVPDFDLILKIYQEENCEIKNILNPLFGAQDYKYNFHYTTFNRNSLERTLLESGFKLVQSWEPGSSPLCSMNDWSKRSIPINGSYYPISLNLEAIK